MPKFELIGRPHVQDGDQILLYSPCEFVARNGLHVVATMKPGVHNPCNFGGLTFGHCSDGSEGSKNTLIRQAIVDEFAIPLGYNNTRPAHRLEMLRNVRCGKFHLRRECLNTS